MCGSHELDDTAAASTSTALSPNSEAIDLSTRLSQSNLESTLEIKEEDKKMILERLIDAHCHPTDSKNYSLDKLEIGKSSLRQICVMSSTLSNQVTTTKLYEAHPTRIIPCYGIHPWFTHHISLLSPPPSKSTHYASLFPTSSTDSALNTELVSSLDLLPDPVSLVDFLTDLEKNLISSKGSFLGEVGLDGAFRVPILRSRVGDSNLIALDTPSVGESRKSTLTTLNTPLTTHQLPILEAQIDIAIKLKKNISLHCVRSTKDVVDLLGRYKNERKGLDGLNLCLHSFGGSPESARDIQRDHKNIFFSFSICVSGRSPRFFEMLRMIQPERILLESDGCSFAKFDEQMIEIFKAVCQARSWTIEECLEQIEKNWGRFLVVPEIEVVVEKLSRREKRLKEKAERVK